MTVTLPTRNELAQIAIGNQRYIKWLEDVTRFASPSGVAGVTTFLRGDGAWVDPFPNGKLVARVNFNGTGVVAIRSASSVASITDGGVGNYTITFATPEPDANYIVVATASDAAFISLGTLTATGFNIAALDANFAAVDPVTVCVSVFR